MMGRVGSEQQCVDDQVEPFGCAASHPDLSDDPADLRSLPSLHAGDSAQNDLQLHGVLGNRTPFSV